MKNFSKIINKFRKNKLVTGISLILIIGIIGVIVYFNNNEVPSPKNNTTIKLHHLKEYKLNLPPKINLMEHTSPGMYYSFELANKVSSLPDKLDLRPFCPPVYDQGQLGTCTTNSNAFLYHYYCKNVLKNDFEPSRFFLDHNISIYATSDHMITSDIIVDSGMQSGSRDLLNITTLAIDGVCSEKNYPYPTKYFQYKYQQKDAKIKHLIETLNKVKNDPHLFTNTLQTIEKLRKSNMYPIPTKENYMEGRKHRLNNMNIYRIKNDLNEIKMCLNYIGPICFGIKMTNYLDNCLNFGISDDAILKKLKTQYQIGQVNIFKHLLSITTNKNDRIILQKMRVHDPSVKYDLYSEKTFNLLNKELDKLTHETYQVSHIKYPHDEINEISKNISLTLIKNKMILLKTLKIDIALEEHFKHIKKPKYVASLLQDIFKPTGGHSMAIVGYDDAKQAFIIRNSWGDSWGDKGYIYLDYEFFINKDPLFGFWIGDMYAIG